MHKTRRAFLKSAGVVATGTALATPDAEAEANDKAEDKAAAVETAPGPVDPEFSNFVVHVYNQSSGAHIQDAIVHLEPRFNGVGYDQQTGSNGQAAFGSGDNGRYDIEVSHQDYYPDYVLNKLLNGTTTPTTLEFPLQHL
ncbi:MAG: hypothetical protein IT366_14360 [Candidatus Hydrogenedentes bacterium]|nr:hypothetical protein [Candidatus Hydrogenedentota bacterium]